MQYDEVKTPEELLDYMNTAINYGFVDDDGNVYMDSNNEEFQKGCRLKWKLSSPSRLIKVKYGHCWDQVELERDWFSKHGYECKTFYIWFELPYQNSYSTHTYLVFRDNDKWYYFEHSDFKHRGIYTFDTLKEAICFQREKHIEMNAAIGEDELKFLKIYEYDTPVYGCNMNDFIDYILENGKIVNYNLK